MRCGDPREHERAAWRLNGDGTAPLRRWAVEEDRPAAGETTRNDAQIPFVIPPSIVSDAPVMYAAFADARNTMLCATSSGPGM